MWNHNGAPYGCLNENETLRIISRYVAKKRALIRWPDQEDNLNFTPDTTQRTQIAVQRGGTYVITGK